MTWILYSGLMYIFSVTLYLALRKLQKKDIPNAINNALMFFFGWIVFALMSFFTKENLIIDFKYIAFIFVITFFCSYLGNKFSLDAIKQAENPGFSLIIQKSYAIYTTIASIFIFGSVVTSKNFLAIIIVIGFLAFMLWDKKFSIKKIRSSKWIVLSFLAFFAFGTLALASKWLLNEGITPLTRTFYVQLFVSMMFLVDLIKQVRKDKNMLVFLKEKSNYIWFVAIGVSNALFNLMMQFAFQSAPNVGYVNIINAASITGITLLSALIYKDKITIQKLIGILGITFGIILLLI